MSFVAPPPLSLYIHIPWCVRKCPYCDFNSHAQHADLPVDAYVAALLRDLEFDLPRVWGRRVQTIFIGGGTPSLFPASAIDALLSGVRARLSVSPDAEITLEANPGTVEMERFRGYRAAGVNRLSIGVQSFAATQLQQLGRIHNRDEAIRAASFARAAGFEQFNLDLMFGLPQQTSEQALCDLEQAIALAPPHLSLYQLTIEPNTEFHRRPPVLPDDELIWDMQNALQARLTQAGYRQYEVSAYARAGHACRHNLNYWRFGDYLGIGAGAHAKISDAQGVTRLMKARQPKDYLRKAGTGDVIVEQRRVGQDELIFEFMLNALRLVDGVDVAVFTAHTGLATATLERACQTARERGLLTNDATRIVPTARGRQFLNDLQMLFLPERAAS